MLQQTLKLASSAERLIGLVYASLATSVEPGSGLGRVLERLASEEDQHARALEKLGERVPADYPGYDYGAVLEGQADFIDSCVYLMYEAHGHNPDVDAILAELVELEGTLAESWLVHIKLLVDEPQKDQVGALAEASAKHAQLLADFLPHIEN